MKHHKAWFGIDSLFGRYSFGTGSAEVPHGIVEPKQTVQITRRSYSMFKGERLFVHRACASDFLIRNCYVGVEISGLANTDPIIAEPFVVDFSDLASISAQMFEKDQPVKIVIEAKGTGFWGAPFPLPVLYPGLDITFGVENIGDKPRRFLAAFLGEILERV